MPGSAGVGLTNRGRIAKKQTYTVEGLAVEAGGAVELTLSSPWVQPVIAGRHRCTLVAPLEFAKGLCIGDEIVLTISKKEE